MIPPGAPVRRAARDALALLRVVERFARGAADAAALDARLARTWAELLGVGAELAEGAREATAWTYYDGAVVAHASHVHLLDVAVAALDGARAACERWPALDGDGRDLLATLAASVAALDGALRPIEAREHAHLWTRYER